MRLDYLKESPNVVPSKKPYISRGCRKVTIIPSKWVVYAQTWLKSNSKKTQEQIEAAKALLECIGANAKGPITGCTYFSKCVLGVDLFSCLRCGHWVANSNKGKHGIKWCHPGNWKRLHPPLYKGRPLCYICFQTTTNRDYDDYIHHLYEDHKPENLKAWGWATYVVGDNKGKAVLAERKRLKKNTKQTATAD